MKKRFLICALLVLALGFTLNETLAYFTSWEITSGNIDIDLVEKTAEGGDFEDVDGVMPGEKVSKIVYVTNTGDNDAYVRIKLDVQIELADGDAEADLDLIHLDLNEDDWTGKDGYYYYNSALKPGKSTKPLFTEVTFSKEMGNDYQNCVATIGVDAQATQVANNGESAVKAAGWPET